MEFLNPTMLYGLFALAIPVIVHLFNFRKHKLVYYSDVSLLENLKQQTSRTSRLRQLIILFLRMLAITAIVLAFARPIFTDNAQLETLGRKTSMIYLDNSRSMQLTGQRGSLIDDARNTAISLVRNLEPDHRFILLTNAFDPAHERAMTRDEIIEKLQFITTGSATISMQDMLSRAEYLAQTYQNEQLDLYLFSDFQQSAFTESDIQPSDQLKLILLPFSAVRQNNVFIDSVWLTNPIVQTGIPVELNVKISNQSAEQLRSLALRLETAEKVLAIANSDIDPQQDKVMKLSFVPQGFGYLNAQLSIADFPVVFDDTYFVSMKIAPQIEVLEIFKQSPDPSLNLLFSDDSLFALSSTSMFRADIQKFSDYQFIIAPMDIELSEGLRAGLMDWVAAGGALLLHPSLEAKIPVSSIDNRLNISIQQLPDTSSTRINSIFVEHPFFDEMFSKIPENADLPKVNFHHRLMPGNGNTTLVSLLNGNPFLSFRNLGQGSVFHLAVPLDQSASGFTESSIFAPLMIRMAFYGLSQSKLSFVLGEDRQISIKASLPGDEVLNIKALNSDFEMIPGMSRRQQELLLSLEEPLPEAGFYSLNFRDSILDVIAWNESRKESQMKFYEVDDAASQFEMLGYDVAEKLTATDAKAIDKFVSAKDKDQWWWFVLMALLFLFAEAFLIRFWKSNKKQGIKN
jgi:hypothetical protein